MIRTRVFPALSRWRAQAVLAVLAVVLAATPPVPERWGDSLAWTLPILAGGCAVATGNWPELLVRFGAMEAVVQGTKSALADAPVNARPRGGQRGFPSAHSAHAAFGAAVLAQECLAGHPVARAGVMLAAGFTGASRVEAGAHNVWQVSAGWLAGLAFAAAFRSLTRRRKRHDQKA